MRLENLYKEYMELLFSSSKDLKKHLKILEEAKKRDHRKLGKELDLFSINDEIGPGLVFYGTLMDHYQKYY